MSETSDDEFFRPDDREIPNTHQSRALSSEREARELTTRLIITIPDVVAPELIEDYVIRHLSDDEGLRFIKDQRDQVVQAAIGFHLRALTQHLVAAEIKAALEAANRILRLNRSIGEVRVEIGGSLSYTMYKGLQPDQEAFGALEGAIRGLVKLEQNPKTRQRLGFRLSRAEDEVRQLVFDLGINNKGINQCAIEIQALIERVVPEIEYTRRGRLLRKLKKHGRTIGESIVVIGAGTGGVVAAKELVEGNEADGASQTSGDRGAPPAATPVASPLATPTHAEQVQHATPPTAPSPSNPSPTPTKQTQEASQTTVSKKTHFIVDKKGNGDYRSISEAIRGAPSGSVIHVRPGIYSESLAINKSLTIEGDGQKSEVVVQAANRSVVVFTGSNGRIANLSLRLEKSTSHFGINIRQGKMVIEDCDISSVSMSCVAIHGGASAIVRQNIIHECPEGGVLFYDRGTGRVEGNTISECGKAGIEVNTTQPVTVVDNLVKSGGACGIHVRRGSGHVIENNDVSQFGSTGIHVKDGAQVSALKNRIFDNSEAGVFLLESKMCNIVENKIFGNGLAGIEIGDEAGARIQGNEIFGNHESGVYFRNTRKPSVVQSNLVFGNGIANISVRNSSGMQIVDNRVYGAHQAGMFFYGESSGEVIENEIFENGSNGIEVKEKSNPSVKGNVFRNNRLNGVYIHDDGRGVFDSSNKILNNMCAGIHVAKGGDPIVAGNVILNNRHQGVAVSEAGRGTFRDNLLKDNGWGPWYLSPDSVDGVDRSGNSE